jgi:hypothetical protein
MHSHTAETSHCRDFAGDAVWTITVSSRFRNLKIVVFGFKHSNHTTVFIFKFFPT